MVVQRESKKSVRTILKRGMKRKSKKSVRTIPKMENLKQITLNAAGIDIGSAEIWVCVPEGREEKSVRMFQTFTRDLHDLVPQSALAST